MADIYDFSHIQEQAYSATQESIGATLQNMNYNASKCSAWIESIGSGTLNSLRELSPNFKYIVNITIHQKTGAGECVKFLSYLTFRLVSLLL